MSDRLWITRGYQPGDLAGILALRLTTFGELDKPRLQPEVWQWQFVDNPAGPGYIRLADHAGTIVGQGSAMATRFSLAWRPETETILALSCDTMTHPAYRKQGMFVTLAKELYAEMAERSGITIVWGFPNANSRPGFVGNLGWLDIYEFPTWVKPIQSRHVIQRYVRSSALAGVLGAAADRLYQLVAAKPTPPRRCTIREISGFDERFATLWTRHRSLARIVQIRDPAYLQWRYLAAPAFEYRPFEVTVDGSLEGYVILRVLTLFDLRFCALVDLFPCPIVDAEITREIFSFAQLYASERSCAFLTALLPPAHVGHLTRFGFVRVPKAMNLRKWYFGARCPAADEPFLRDINNWYITYGDSDIV
jgi:hypothetical protein